MYFIYLVDQRRWKLLGGVLDLGGGWARISWETQKLWKLTIIIWILFGKSWLYILMISSAFIRCDDKLCFHQMKLSCIYLVCWPVPRGRNFRPFFFSFWSIYWKFGTFLIMTIIWIFRGKSWLYMLMISSAFIWWTCHAFILFAGQCLEGSGAVQFISFLVALALVISWS